MCTLTIIPYSEERRPDAAGPPRAGVRIACNRDESRLRPAATPPRARQFGGRAALLPIDPVGRGTWIAASDAPLAFSLMNVYTEPIGSRPIAVSPRSEARVSRGTIIPQVLPAATVAEALDRAGDLDRSRYEPFRLVIAGPQQVAQVVWADGRFEISDAAPIGGPLFFTSSGLGDQLVAGPRRRLFDQVFSADVDRPAAQDAFHRHVWPGREFASVWMTRPEARTVSLTVVELAAPEVRMRYYVREDDDSDARESHDASLPIAAGRAGRAS